MIQLIRLMRDAEDFNTGGSIQQTPIELAISELEEELKHIHDETSIGGISGLIKMKLQFLLPYEKQYLRDVAEKAWDAAKKYTFENVSIEHDYVRDMDFIEIDYSSIEKDKQTYLNQNHPL